MTKKMKYFFLGCLTLFLSNRLNAQDKITGKILDVQKMPLSGITVSLYQADSVPPQMVGFFISGNDGDFTITIPRHFKKFIIKTSSLSYKSQIDSFALSENINTINKIFTLVESVSYLDTVSLSAEFKFRQSGDTITLNPSAFALKNENNLEQLLERLPGITVDEQGKMSFNGTPITSILIDGDDLFQNNYQQLTRNASPDIVNKVDIIKNYQRDSNLKGYKINNGQVINLRLKDKYKHYTFGYAEAGLGSNNDKLGNLFLMKLQDSSKLEIKVGYNNVGNISTFNNKSTEPEDLTSQNSNFFSYDPVQYKLDVNKYYDKYLPLNSQQINKSLEIGANWLLKLPNKWELLINCNLLADSVYQQQDIFTNYINQISTERNNIRHSNDWTQKYGLNITHILNGSSFYFNIDYTRRNNTDLVYTDQPPLIPVVQNLEGHNYFLNINGNYNKKLTQNILWVSTFHVSQQPLLQNYYDNPDSLFWQSPLTDSNLYQLHSYFNNYAKQIKIKSTVLFKNRSDIQSISFQYYKEINYLKSNLQYIDSFEVGLPAEYFTNNNLINSNKVLIAYFGSKTFGGKHTFTVNLLNVMMRAQFDSSSVENKFINYLPDYSLEYKYSISNYSFISLNGGFQKTSPNFQDIYGNSLLNGYRTIVSGYPGFYNFSKIYAQLLFSNMNLIKSNWISFLYARINFIDDKYMKSIYISNTYTKNGYTYFLNKPKEIISFYNAQKLLEGIKIKLIGKVGFGYRDLFYLNADSLFKSHLINLNASIGIRSYFNSFYNFDYIIGIQNSANKVVFPNSYSSNVNSLNQKLICYFVFNVKSNLSLSYQHVDEFSTNHQQYNLFDFSITHKLFREKIDIECIGSNLLNDKKISSTLISPFYTENNTIYIRPREVYFSLKYHFN